MDGGEEDGVCCGCCSDVGDAATNGAGCDVCDADVADVLVRRAGCWFGCCCCCLSVGITALSGGLSDLVGFPPFAAGAGFEVEEPQPIQLLENSMTLYACAYGGLGAFGI